MKGKGIFDLLDEESKLPTPKPDHFTMEVHNRNKNHFRLSVSYTLFSIGQPYTHGKLSFL